MEEVNKNFLRAKYKSGNNFITNIDPYDEELSGYFSEEIKWLKEFGGKYWKPIGENLWKLIK